MEQVEDEMENLTDDLFQFFQVLSQPVEQFADDPAFHDLAGQRHAAVGIGDAILDLE